MDLLRRNAMTMLAVASAMSVGGQVVAAEPQSCCPIVELRQYAPHPGKRDTLIVLFDREFVESQEALGATVIGQFRDLGDPNRFVWLRGFADMPSRATALSAFYGGPVWKAHSKAANATMIDSDNVLLLHPSRPTTGFQGANTSRPPPGAAEPAGGIVVATIYYFDAPLGDEFTDFFEHAIAPVVTRAGGSVLAQLVTDHSANNFPALPVREGENAFVWFSGFQSLKAYEDHRVKLAASRDWQMISPLLRGRLKAEPQILTLQPTARSQLHG